MVTARSGHLDSCRHNTANALKQPHTSKEKQSQCTWEHTSLAKAWQEREMLTSQARSKASQRNRHTHFPCSS